MSKENLKDQSPKQSRPIEGAVPQSYSSQDDEIDLQELAVAIWQGKWLILCVSLFCVFISGFYAKSLPDTYKSEVLLAPVSDASGMRVPSQLGGLAALAGVSLGGGGGDKTSLAIQVLQSRAFIGRFIESNDLFVPVMAVQGWERLNNTLKIDPEKYNIEENKWVRNPSPPQQAKPSVLEAYDAFKKLLSVSKDKNSGMVTLSIEHYSPFLAQQWVSILVKEINEEVRRRDLKEAELSITYLTNQINKTAIADVRATLFSLIEEQTKTVMLANVRDEYVFKTIDPAVVPEKKAGPKRAVIVMLAACLGLMLSIIVVLFRYFLNKGKEATTA